MGIPVIDTDPFTIEDFYAFTDARPDEERWELIEGELVLNASPATSHQEILRNVLFCLEMAFRRQSSPWTIIPGIGALISNTSRLEPNLMVLARDHVLRNRESRDTRDATVLFEVLSPSTASRDLKWKRTAYTGLPALMHYVVIAQDAVDVVVFARDQGFAEQRFRSLTDEITFTSIGVSLSLAEIYRDTGLT
jgi:Uma2 family endonuclease